MAKRTQTYKLIETIINAIDKTLYVKSITEDSEGIYTIESCNTLWLTKGFTITINSVAYEILSVNPNVSFQISGASLPSATSFTIYPPKYLHGTLIASVAEFNQKEVSNDKLPMIWLHQMTREKHNNNPEESLERESDCELLFLVDSNIQFTTNNSCELGVQPMRNLYAAFMEALKVASNVMDLSNYGETTVDHATFGFKVQKGTTQTWFDAVLAGVQMNMTIPFLKTQECC